jgi:hypothetical protein
MIRTMWLGLACLIALGVMVALRFVVTKTGAENVSSVSLTTATAPPIYSGDGTLTKGDRLELFHPPEQPSVPAISLIASKPPQTAVKIISRHWHEALAKQPPTKPHSRDAKTMTPKTEAQ